MVHRAAIDLKCFVLKWEYVLVLGQIFRTHTLRCIFALIFINIQEAATQTRNSQAIDLHQPLHDGCINKKQAVPATYKGL